MDDERRIRCVLAATCMLDGFWACARKPGVTSVLEEAVSEVSSSMAIRRSVSVELKSSRSPKSGSCLSILGFMMLRNDALRLEGDRLGEVSWRLM